MRVEMGRELSGDGDSTPVVVPELRPHSPHAHHQDLATVRHLPGLEPPTVDRGGCIYGVRSTEYKD